MFLRQTALGAMVGLSAACGSPAGTQVGDRSAAVTVSNGTNLNGTNLNGTNLNGTNLNGTNLNGTNLNGSTLGGSSINGLHLEGSQLVGQHGNNGRTLSGTDLVGAQLTGSLSNGDTLTLRIDGVSQGAAPNDDIYYYSVSYEHQDGTWDSLCADASGPLPAVAVAGTWNYNFGSAGGGSHADSNTQFTFGCKNGAIAACAEWGYKPWSSVNGISLAGYHQTCTRVKRADFCGDGTSYTVNGQLIDIYDAIGIQSDDENWFIEAEWDQNGARCFQPLNRSHAWVPCFDLKSTLTCGDSSHFSTGTLIMDETPTQAP